MITRTEAERILAHHSLAPTDPTAWHPEENRYDPTSTFDDIVGVKPEYRLMEVLDFFGLLLQALLREKKKVKDA